MKGVDFIVEYLKRHEKVSHVFTYAGGTNAWLLDALHRAQGISYLPMRHEQNAAFAAEGYARASGLLGVALTMSGPGATNLITGIADAFFDSIPVLFLTGQVTTTTYKFHKPVRQLGYQETDIVSIAKSITKSAMMAESEKEMTMMLRKSISIAKANRPGPVLLDIPTDIQRREVDPQELTIKPVVSNNPCASADEVDQVFHLIKNSRRPVVLVGGGVRAAESCQLLLEFINRFKIPVVVSLRGKDAFPHDHPLFAGFIGSYGNRYANLTLVNSDLVIALGSRLDSRQTADPKTFAREAKKIHVDIDFNELNNTVIVDLAIHSHLKSFFKLILLKDCTKSSFQRQEWLKYIQEVKKVFAVDGIGETQKVDPKAFLRTLSRAAVGNEIFLADVGNHQMWTAQELSLRGDQRFLTSSGLGTMGFSIPAGIGAYCACPDRNIVSIVGDGGFQMSIPEIETIVRNKIPLKIIVFNNNILGLMWHFQNENFTGGHPATEDKYSCPDVQKVACAYGLSSKRLENNSEVKEGIQWLLSSDGPALLEVAVHPSWAAYPKVKPGNPLEGQLPEVDKNLLAQYMLIGKYKD